MQLYNARNMYIGSRQVIEKEFITQNCIVSTIFPFIELCRAI